MPSVRETALERVSKALDALKRNEHLECFKLLVSAVEMDPTCGSAWYYLGLQFQSAKKFHSAAIAFKRALDNVPEKATATDRAVMLTNVGYNLHLSERTEEGIPYLEEACRTAPTMALQWLDLAQCYGAVGRKEDSLKTAKRAVLIDPKECRARLTLAFSQLFVQDYRNGFINYEARFKFKLPEVLTYPAPQWRGGKVETLLLLSEQGIGDTLMMARFIRHACERAERVIFFAHKETITLMEANVPSNVTVQGMPAPFPKADAFCLLMSLPIALNFEAEELKTKYRAPYIGHVYNWDRKKEKKKGLNVGITWGGDPEHDLDSFRSIRAGEFLRLAEVDGVTLHSLQVGKRNEDLGTEGMYGLVRDEAPNITNFADTSRIVADLDVVVSCDTSIVHLCGAMGKTCWVLVNEHALDWRWLREGTATPWYPSVKVYRKKITEQWKDVMIRVANDLEKMVPCQE